MEEIIEKHLLDEANNSDYDLKKMDVMIKYLIYQQLKEINNNLSLIDEALSMEELEK
jgi:hypothetical protein